MTQIHAETWAGLAGLFEAAAVPRLPLTEWAAKYRRIVGGARAGPWNPANAPMSLEPMAALSDRRVGTLLDFQYGKGLKASERLDEGPIPVFGSNGIVGFTDEPMTVRPTIIVGRKGSAGALNLCDGPCWTTDVAYFVEAPSFFTIRFLANALAALDLDNLRKGVKPGISRSDAYEKFLNVPPLAEQHRIVAKVDELMALCDGLEAARAEREATRTRTTNRHRSC